MRPSALLLCALLLCPPFAYPIQTPGTVDEPISSAVPKLEKEAKKALDKNGNNAYKRCSSEPGPDPGIVAGACLDLSFALRNQAKDASDAHQALERSCSLGNAGGCNELAKDLDASGDHAGAIKLWSAPLCSGKAFCDIALFDSLTSHEPMNLYDIGQVGMPLCDGGGNDKVCERLAQLGVRADYASIAQRHREIRIQNLRAQIQSADQAAVNDESGARQLEQTPSTSPYGALISSSGAATMRISAERERNKASDLRNQLSKLTSEPVQAPTVSEAPYQPAYSAAPTYQPAKQQQPVSSPSVAHSMTTTQQAPRLSTTPGTLQNTYPSASHTTAPSPQPLAQTPAPTAQAATSVSIGNLSTSLPTNSGQYCQPPCATGEFCTGNGGNSVTTTFWNQTTSYTVAASSNTSVKVTINMSDGSQQVIPMYAFQGSSPHQFTMNVGCSTYAPQSINATQAFISTD